MARVFVASGFFHTLFRQGTRADPGDYGGEARGHAAEPGPDQDDDRPCQQAAGTGFPIRERGPTPRGNEAAQALDDAGEAFARRWSWGGARCSGHEGNKT
jgi:hypothetical protein